ncbi:hypothetical protein PBY51_015971 [Eleginops maclovinus]|uniref:Signal-transducing adaptor protein 1 n=1 Tax=Eleginops maclovinus TaxID=56733 RepID=A0AAN7XPS3_ELEMC|nr:hypothetical protein PBY51_015971 [Eleginops maclovinus]
MSVPTRIVHKRRATITDLPLYYCGQLRKKLPKEKDFKRYYSELRGATLFLYKDDTQDTYMEKLDLGQLKSMELNSPYEKKTPTIFTLTLPTEEVQLKMDNSDTGEEWRGYILTVVNKEIPSKLQLLPGQMLQLKEALDKERQRNPTTPRPALPPRPHFLRTPSPFQSPLACSSLSPCPSASTSSSPSASDSASTLDSPSASDSTSSTPPKDKPDNSSPENPACFFNVSRKEAERMLGENPEYGSIILRPSTLANNYALTLRQQTPSGPIMKNFRVTSTNVGFVIELDTAVTVSSLNEVLKYFLEKTEYRLYPYMVSQPYDTCIDMSPISKCVNISSPILKTIPKAQVAPMLRSEAKRELQSPPTNQDEGEYVFPDGHVEADGELQVLKLQRKNLYTNRETEKVTTHENPSSEKTQSAAVQWQRPQQCEACSPLCSVRTASF